MKKGYQVLVLLIIGVYLLTLTPLVNSADTEKGPYTSQKELTESQIKAIEEKITQLETELSSAEKSVTDFETKYAADKGKEIYEEGLKALKEKVESIKTQIKEQGNLKDELNKSILNLLKNLTKQTFERVWRIIEWIFIPLCLAILIKLYLLDLIIGKIPVLKSLSVLKLGNDTVSFAIWIVGTGIIYYLVKEKEFAKKSIEFFKENIVLPMVTKGIKLLGLEPSDAVVWIMTLAVLLIILLLLGFLFKLIKYFVEKMFGIEARAEKLGERAAKGIKAGAAIEEGLER